MGSTWSNVALLLHRASEKNLTIVRNGLELTRRKRLHFWQFYDAINGSTRKFWHSGEVLCVLENQSIACIGDSGENIPLLGVLTWLLLKPIKSLYHTGCTSLHCSGSAKRLEKSCREIFKKPSWYSQGTHQDICISSISQRTYCRNCCLHYYICLNKFL